MKEPWQLNVMCNPGLDPKQGGKSYKIHYWDNWWNQGIDVDKKYCINVTFLEVVYSDYVRKFPYWEIHTEALRSKRAWCIQSIFK